MRNLRLYNTDAAFKAKEQSVGGDGSSVVSIVPGVSKSKDTRDNYFNPKDGSVKVLTVTKKYIVSGSSIDIFPSASTKVKYVSGTTSPVNFNPKSSLYYEPAEQFARATFPNDTAITFNYVGKCFHECTYNVTTTSEPTVLYSDGTNSKVAYLVIDDVVYTRTSAFTFNETGEHTVKIYMSGSVEDSKAMPQKMFVGSTALTKIKVCEGLRDIANYAFCGCNQLTEIEVPDSLTGFGDGSFASAFTSGLDLILPDGLKRLGAYCFGFSNIKSVYMPDSITAIGRNCFYLCKQMSDVRISEQLTVLPIQTFDTCCSLKSVVVPNSVTSFAAGSIFDSCSGLTAVTLPPNLDQLGSGTFENCSSLETITSLSPVAPGYKYNTFRRVKENGTIYCPAGSRSSYYNSWVSGASSSTAKLSTWTIVEI